MPKRFTPNNSDINNNTTNSSNNSNQYHQEKITSPIKQIAIPILLIVGVITIVITTLIISFRPHKTNNTTDRQPKHEFVQSQTDTDSTDNTLTKHKAHNKVKTFFTSQNLQPSQLMTVSEMKTMTQELFTLTDEHATDQFKTHYKVSKYFDTQLPHGKNTGTNTHINSDLAKSGGTYFSYSYLYLGAPKNINVALDYQNLQTNKAVYLVAFTMDGVPQYYLFTCQGNILLKAHKLNLS